VTVEDINAVTQDDCSTYHAFFLHKKPISIYIRSLEWRLVITRLRTSKMSDKSVNFTDTNAKW